MGGGGAVLTGLQASFSAVPLAEQQMLQGQEQAGDAAWQGPRMISWISLAGCRRWCAWHCFWGTGRVATQQQAQEESWGAKQSSPMGQYFHGPVEFLCL